MARAKASPPHAEAKPKHTPRPHAPVDLKAYTISQFCEAYNMSIWTYFRLAKAGNGPEIMKLNQKTLIAIADAEAWQETRKAVAREQRQKKREAASAEA